MHCFGEGDGSEKPRDGVFQQTDCPGVEELSSQSAAQVG